MYKGPFPLTQNNGGRSTTDLATGVSSGSSTRQVRLVNGSFTSVNTPNFRSLKRKQLPHNPFSHVCNEQINGTGVIASRDTITTGYVGFHSDVDTSLLISATAVSVEKKARSKVLSSIKDTSFNAAQAFAERRQTANLIATSVNRLVSAALAVRRGNFNHAVTLFGQKYTGKNLLRDRALSKDNLANHWLEFQYGWKPLLNDIYGAAELIAKTYNSSRPTIVRSKAEEKYTKSGYEVGYWAQGPNTAALMCTSLVTCTSRYVIELVEDDAVLSRMSNTGITNPLLLGWELLPYSFVVDWFVPVGNYLANLDAAVGLSFLKGSVTNVVRADHSASWQMLSRDELDPVTRASYQPYLIKRFSKVRSTLNGFPTPPLPAFEPSLGVTRALSGMALLNQLFKGSDSDTRRIIRR